MEANSGDIPLSARPSARTRAVQFILVWLGAEFFIGVLQPIFSGALLQYMSGHQAGVRLAPSFRNAGELVTASLALAASRVPELLESDPRKDGTQRRILFFLLVIAITVSTLSATNDERLEEGLTTSRGVSQQEVYHVSVGILLFTLLLGVWAQILRARAESEEPAAREQPTEHQHFSPLPPDNHRPPNHPSRKRWRAVWASMTLAAIAGFSLGRRSRQ